MVDLSNRYSGRKSMRITTRALALLAFISGSAAAQNAVPMQSKPLDPVNLDRSVSACTDFYQFANGGWINTHPVPPAYPVWGSFAELSENNQSHLLTILRNASASGDKQANADLRRLATYYESCMDSAGTERAGYQPIQPELARVAAISSRSQLEAEVARLHSQGIPAVF